MISFMNRFRYMKKKTILKIFCPLYIIDIGILDMILILFILSNNSKFQRFYSQYIIILKPIEI